MASRWLLEEFIERVLDALGITMIAEAARELRAETELGFNLAQQQTARIGGNLAAVKCGEDCAVTQSLEIKNGWRTRCPSATASCVWDKDLLVKPLCQIRGQGASVPVRIAG